jgi:hypothetical protein
MKNVRCPHGYNFNNITKQCDPVSKIRGKIVPGGDSVLTPGTAAKQCTSDVQCPRGYCKIEPFMDRGVCMVRVTGPLGGGTGKNRNNVFCTHWNMDKTEGSDCEVREPATGLTMYDVCYCNGECDCSGGGSGGDPPINYDYNCIDGNCVSCTPAGCGPYATLNQCQNSCSSVPDDDDYTCYNPGQDCSGQMVGKHGGICDCDLNCVAQDMSGGVFPSLEFCKCANEYNFETNGHFLNTDAGCNCQIPGMVNQVCTGYTTDWYYYNEGAGCGTFGEPCHCGFCWSSSDICMSDNVFC